MRLIEDSDYKKEIDIVDEAKSIGMYMYQK